MVLSIVSCDQTSLKEIKNTTPFCSKALKEQVDKLISMDSGYKNIIDVYIYGRGCIKIQIFDAPF